MEGDQNGGKKHQKERLMPYKRKIPTGFKRAGGTTKGGGNCFGKSWGGKPVNITFIRGGDDRKWKRPEKIL